MIIDSFCGVWTSQLESFSVAKFEGRL
uniref:Uncharacterized protein n=1 Tax=Lepeophtheirus salmonis TaxID=72036 RepID=A0A0K2T5K2_LEPSM